MKERPILFSAPMVRAILDGRKTQTRRIMKPQPEKVGDGYLRPLLTDCPYGWKGDLLWVRETFCKSPDGPIYRASESDAGVLKPDDHIVWKPSIHMPKKYARIWLEVTGIRVERLQDISGPEIEKEGVVKGCCNGYLCDCRGGYVKPIDGEAVDNPFLEFCDLWESINGKGSWDENPWVWVVEFQRTDQAKAA